MKPLLKRLVLATLLAVVAGPFAVLVRLARLGRRRGQPRIVRGPTPVALVPETTRADRLLGYQSRVVCRSLRGYAYSFLRPEEFDLVLDWPRVPQALAGFFGFLYLLVQGDIWVTYFDGSFVQDDFLYGWELRLARLAGIKIIVSGYGRDCTLADGRPTRFDWVARLLQDYCYPPEHFARVKANLARCSRLADFIIAPDHCFKPWFPRADCTFKIYAIDCEVLRPAAPPSNPVPVIVHAPNHRHVKGTDFLLAACTTLRQRGCQFQLRIVERVNRQEALEIYRSADILADQFVMGNFATLAMEGLALGKPVLSYSSTEELLDPRFNLPLINTHPGNIVEVLYLMIELPVLRQRLGQLGREAVARYQSLRPVGEVWDRIFQHVWHGTELQLADTAIFSPRRPPRSTVEDPLQADFWPPELHDLMGQIQGLLTAFRRQAQAA